MRSAHFSKWITFGSLIGLCAGLTVGSVVHRTGNPHLRFLIHSLEPFAAIWLNALQLLVFPLIISVVLVSIASTGNSQKPGRMGSLTLLAFLAVLCLGAAFSFFAASLSVGGFSIDPRAILSFNPDLAGASPAVSPVAQSPWEWLRSLVSYRIATAAASRYILPLLVATVLLAIVARNLQDSARARCVSFFSAMGDVSIAIVRWLFYALPVVVFILVSAIYSRSGSLVVTGISYYILTVCATMLGFTAVQYLIAWLAGGVSVGRFARSLWPAQVTAVTTRSSLASLPPLLDAALDRMALPRTVAAFVLPLSVSTFKASQSIYPLFKLIFLAHIFGVSLRPGPLLLFVVGVFVLSFAAPGVPSGGSLHTIPLLLALGIPMQGIILFNSVEAIPDIFETLLNVTSDMAVATVVSRFLCRSPELTTEQPKAARQDQSDHPVGEVMK